MARANGAQTSRRRTVRRRRYSAKSVRVHLVCPGLLGLRDWTACRGPPVHSHPFGNWSHLMGKRSSTLVNGLTGRTVTGHHNGHLDGVVLALASPNASLSKYLPRSAIGASNVSTRRWMPLGTSFKSASCPFESYFENEIATPRSRASCSMRSIVKITCPVPGIRRNRACIALFCLLSPRRFRWRPGRR